MNGAQIEFLRFLLIFGSTIAALLLMAGILSVFASSVDSLIDGNIIAAVGKTVCWIGLTFLVLGWLG